LNLKALVGSGGGPMYNTNMTGQYGTGETENSNALLMSASPDPTRKLIKKLDD
jgi:hypothetical protein